MRQCETPNCDNIKMRISGILRHGNLIMLLSIFTTRGKTGVKSLSFFVCRHSVTANTTAFQAVDASSILVVCSNEGKCRGRQGQSGNCLSHSMQGEGASDRDEYAIS